MLGAQQLSEAINRSFILASATQKQKSEIENSRKISFKIPANAWRKKKGYHKQKYNNI